MFAELPLLVASAFFFFTHFRADEGKDVQRVSVMCGSHVHTLLWTGPCPQITVDWTMSTVPVSPPAEKILELRCFNSKSKVLPILLCCLLISTPSNLSCYSSGCWTWACYCSHQIADSPCLMFLLYLTLEVKVIYQSHVIPTVLQPIKTNENIMEPNFGRSWFWRRGQTAYLDQQTHTVLSKADTRSHPTLLCWSGSLSYRSMAAQGMSGGQTSPLRHWRCLQFPTSFTFRDGHQHL